MDRDAFKRTRGTDNWLDFSRPRSNCEGAGDPVSASQVALAARLVPQRPSFEMAQAELAADIFNSSGRRRGSLVDCMIAAAVVHANASIATLNVGDFSCFRSHGVKVLQ